VQIPDVLVFCYGPLPETVCNILALMRSSIVGFFVIMLDVTAILKLIFIFVLQNPAAFNDDFWWTFLTIGISLGTMIGSYVDLTITRFMSMGNYICTGGYPYKIDYPKMGPFLLNLISIVLQIYAKVQIYFYRKKIENKTMLTRGAQPLNTSYVIHSRNVHPKVDLNKYFSTLVRVLILTALLISFFIYLKANQLTYEELRSLDNNFYVYMRNFFVPNIIIITFLSFTYSKKEIWKFFIEEILVDIIRSYFSRNSSHLIDLFV